MYNNKFVVAVKHNNQILKEFQDTVYLPFGSEYSLYLKNLDSVRALAKVWIDGVLVTEGLEVVVPANGCIDLERFIRNGNLTTGNKFKFIERSDAVEAHRGVQAEDGLVRVEFSFETRPVISTDYWRSKWPYSLAGGIATNDSLSKGIVGELGGCFPNSPSFTCDVNGDHDSLSFNQTPISGNVGITAAGSASEQNFTLVSWFPTESVSHTIVLRLLGKTEAAQVVQPVTVKSVPKCTSCGRKNKIQSKFCTQCGTALIII